MVFQFIKSKRSAIYHTQVSHSLYHFHRMLWIFHSFFFSFLFGLFPCLFTSEQTMTPIKIKHQMKCQNMQTDEHQKKNRTEYINRCESAEVLSIRSYFISLFLLHRRCSLVEFLWKRNNSLAIKLVRFCLIFSCCWFFFSIKCKNYADVAHGAGENNVDFDINSNAIIL